MKVLILCDGPGSRLAGAKPHFLNLSTMLNDVNTGGVVDAFDEKPQVSAGWISGGFFVFSRSVLDRLPNGNLMLDREPMQQLARDGGGPRAVRDR